MAITRQAAPVAVRPIGLNGRGTAVETAETGPRRAGEFGDAARSMLAGGLASPEAVARSCVLAARSILPGGTPDRYTRLLYAIRDIERAAPGDGRSAAIVRRMLAAADRADGPANGVVRVIEAMEAEAAAVGGARRGL